eukprot:TRINITY_DN14395_c0_g2_i2.p1 TRINITY_DN14395_c0_g2~~TRINITY_DN14395_c0_g2_i2.p1  ORF type:complete len:618 (+),score=180.44 TRINITY_DN14395_c0_g2_i2:65-1918(+)
MCIRDRFTTDSYGRTSFGTCSIKTSGQGAGSNTLIAIPMGAYALFTSIILYHVRNRLSVLNSQDRKEFIDFYWKYGWSTIVIWTFIALTYMFAMLKTWDDIPDVVNEIVRASGNVAKCVSTIVLTYLRFREPFLKQKLFMTLKKIKNFLLCRSSKRDSGSGNQLGIPLLNDSRESSDHAVQIGRASLQSDDDDAEGHDEREMSSSVEASTITGMQKKLRRSLIVSTLAALRHHIIRGFSNITIGGNTPTSSEIRPSIKRGASLKVRKDSREITETCYSVSFDDIRDNEGNAIDGQKEFILNMILISSASNLFSEIFAADKWAIDALAALDINRNEKQIQKAGSAHGGAGGEFMFFSHNKQLIMKTLNHCERTFLDAILPDYHFHLKNNPNSLILKYFGLFTIDFPNALDEKIHVILMKHLMSGMSESFVTRTYDIKGSSVNRQVIKNYGNVSVEALSKVLKDTDFLNLEKKLYLDAEEALRLNNTVEKDAKFLASLGIMDYSLLIKKVVLDPLKTDSPTDIEKFREFARISIQGLAPNPHLFKSNRTEKNKNGEDCEVYYLAGILDYLQLFDIKKKGEAWLKRLGSLNINLDISAQEPETYLTRFIVFVQKISSLQE